MKLEIRKLLVLSTAHLTEETAALLEQPHPTWPCCGGPYSTYGWFVYAHGDNFDEIPEDLWAVMVFARAQGCDNILFDCDANTIEELPVYDW